MQINYIDIVILIFVSWGLFQGFRKGFIIEVASLAALALGIWGAFHFSAFISTWLKTELHWEFNHLYLVAVIITFVCIVAIVFILAKLLEKIVKISALGVFNRLAGALFGTAKFLMLLAMLGLLINKADKHEKIISAKAKTESVFYTPVMKGTFFLYKKYTSHF